MIFLFEIPEIKDQVILPKLLKQGAGTHNQFQFLSTVQDLRNSFKQIVNFNSLNSIKLGNSMLQYEKQLEQYLKTNVDTMQILSTTPSFPAQFSYKTFLDESKQEQQTSLNNEESCACEIVMARYGFAFLYFMDSYPQLGYIRQKFPSSFAENSIHDEQYINEIDQCLKKFKIGIEPIIRLYNVMPDVLKSLIKKKENISLEFRGETLQSIKQVLQCNANSLFIEKLRIQKDYNKLAKVAKSSFTQLNAVHQTFFGLDGKNIKLLIQFCNIGMIFFKSLGLWAIMKINEYYLKAEDYTHKNFIVLSKEMINISKYILSAQSQLIQNKIDADFYDYAVQYFKLGFQNICQHSLKVYEGIHRDNQLGPQPDEIFMGISETLDCFN